MFEIVADVYTILKTKCLVAILLAAPNIFILARQQKRNSMTSPMPIPIPGKSHGRYPLIGDTLNLTSTYSTLQQWHCIKYHVIKGTARYGAHQCWVANVSSYWEQGISNSYPIKSSCARIRHPASRPIIEHCLGITAFCFW